MWNVASPQRFSLALGKGPLKFVYSEKDAQRLDGTSCTTEELFSSLLKSLFAAWSPFSWSWKQSCEHFRFKKKTNHTLHHPSGWVFAESVVLLPDEPGLSSALYSDNLALGFQVGARKAAALLKDVWATDRKIPDLWVLFRFSLLLSTGWRLCSIWG